MALVKIGSCYIALLTFATVLCFRAAGVREIVSYASASKPYSILFRQNLWGGFSHRRTTGERQQSANILCFGDSNMFYPFGLDNNENLALLLEETLDDGVDPPPPKVSKWDFMDASMFDYYCMFHWAVESPSTSYSFQ